MMGLTARPFRASRRVLSLSSRCRVAAKVACIASLVLAPFVAPGFAQQGPVLLTLQQAIDRAAATSARIRDVRARGVAAEATVRGARAADDPQLTLLGGFSRTNHVDEFGVPQPDGRLRVIFPDVPSNYQTRMDAQWPLFTSGRVQALERSATADVAATQFDERTLRADIALETARTYWAVVAGGFAAEVIRASVARLDAHLGDVRARVAAGVSPPNEVAAVEAQRAAEQATLIETQLQTDQQRLLLRHLVGLPLDATLELIEPVDPAAAVAPASAPADVAGRPELLSVEARAKAAGARAEAAAAERGPVLALAGGVDLARPNTRRFPRQDIWQHSWDVGVQVSWALFDAGRVEARRAAAVATESALREQRTELAGRLAVEVAQRRLEVMATAARVQATETGVTAAQENLRVVKARFDAGVATNTDVVDAETTLLRAELDRTRARVNTHLAAALLARALAR